LAIKNKVAGASLAEIPAYQVGVVEHQRLRIGELGEAAVVEVCGRERSGTYAEEIRSQGCLR